MSLDEGLWQNNARFVSAVNRILERYNYPFEDDLLISMETLTYATSDGTKQWENVSTKKLKEWKKEVLKCDKGWQRNADSNKIETKFDRFEEKMNNDSGLCAEVSKQQTSDSEDGYARVHQVSPENSCMDTSDIDEESDIDIVSVRRELEGIHLQNPCVNGRKIQDNIKVQVDVIVQDNNRHIPKWIAIPAQSSSRGLHLASSMQGLIGKPGTACRRTLELSDECSSFPPLQFPGVSMSPDIITRSRHQLSPELNQTCCESILEEYQSADEECSWSNTTLVDLYPAMVETFKRLMRKQSRIKEFRYTFGYLMSKRWRSRRPKLNVIVDKIRGFRHPKLKRALPSICSSSRSEDIQNKASETDNRAFCPISDLSGPVPFSYLNKSDIQMEHCDSILEHHLIPGKGQKVSKRTFSPNVMARMGETFLVEDEAQTAVSLNKSKGNEKLPYRCFSECHLVTSAASSKPTALHLLRESKAQAMDFHHGDAPALCSSACSYYGSSKSMVPFINSSPSRPSNSLLLSPKKIISGKLIPLQYNHSFSLLSMKQSLSKVTQKCDDAFENLYYKLHSKEIQKPLALPSSPSNSRDLEDKGRSVKSHLSDSVRFSPHCDREFDKICEKLCNEAVPKLPTFQRASYFKKYEGIQMSATVNALVNSPVRARSPVPRMKRLLSFQNYHLCSPSKRLKSIPECYFPSPKCQQTSVSKSLNLERPSMDFLTTYSGSNPSFFDSCSCQSQDSGFHAFAAKPFLGVPGTSMQDRPEN